MDDSRLLPLRNRLGGYPTRYKNLKRTGLKASVLACGSHIYPSKIMNFPGVSQEQCNEVYNYALDNGINVIATNTAYKIAEDRLYRAIGNRRDQFILSIGTDYRSEKLAEKDINRSLEKFHTDFIDIYQMSGIRRVDAVDRALRPDGALQALVKAKRQGKIGHIGVTGHSPDALAKAINSGEIECCQFVLNLAVRQSLKKLLPVAKEQNVDLFVMRPLEDGWLKSKAQMGMRFLFSSPADVVISGMYTKEVIDTNIALGEMEPTQDEWPSLLKEAENITPSQCEACMLCKGHWIDYDGTACPKWIDIYDLIAMRNFRRRYGLSPDQETRYRSAADKIKECDECMRCEAVCIYNVPIVHTLHEIADELKLYNPHTP